MDFEANRFTNKREGDPRIALTRGNIDLSRHRHLIHALFF
jgi:hypothetical protein